MEAADSLEAAVTDRVAIVTGGASGIGRALAAALTGRGDTVLVADAAGDAAKAVAAELTGRGRGVAVPAEVDVRDAAAVQDLVDTAYREYGRLDLMANNAGIAVGGLVEEMTLDHWNATIDVNLRGVVHGVHAAYPRMVRRRAGQILNTASLAGLTEPPMMAPYTATKHAVVGLTLSLRAEAARHGVRVSVLCPGFVDTPLLDRVNQGLPQTEAGRTARASALRIQRRLYPPDRLAADVLRGLDRDTAVIVAPLPARVAWYANRYLPGLVRRIVQAQGNRDARRLGY
jgi:NAD(P)-dependent dehydrogenase (short-subunit alcohol dehydrogenase family)